VAGAAGIAPAILPAIAKPGTPADMVSPAAAEQTGLRGAARTGRGPPGRYGQAYQIYREAATCSPRFPIAWHEGAQRERRRRHRGRVGHRPGHRHRTGPQQGRVPFLADYVASKFGVVGLTQAMAFELAPYGIRVNSVCPGYVATPMQDRELGWEAGLRGVSPDQVRRLWIDDTPLGRLETSEDVARAVAFLAGPDAGFITGEALAVNGGAFMD
jgi:NAD(P)-dependent dehydrogenase (short-subunit alcohol dehydrogenase family)